MKRSVRLMLLLSVISGTLCAGSHTVSAKIALIKREGDRIHITYQHGDNYRQKAVVPRRPTVDRVQHHHFHHFPSYGWSGFAGSGYRVWNYDRYPIYFR